MRSARPSWGFAGALVAAALQRASGSVDGAPSFSQAAPSRLRGAAGWAAEDRQLSSAAFPAPGPGMRKVSLAGADPLATCNDGTPGVYYWAPGAGAATSWLFLLGERGWCWDAASCAARELELVSSRAYPDTIEWDPEAIFGTNSRFVGWNRVWVPQCSSDAWMGDIGADQSRAGVNWRGARIFKTALREVAKGMHEGDLLVFGGASAGARGAMVHLDTIKPQGLIPEGVRLVGYLDSPYYVEMPAFDGKTGVDFQLTVQTQEVASAMENEAILRGDGACEFDEAWKCAFGEYRVPILKTPFLLMASQYDWYGLVIAEGADMGSVFYGKHHCFPSPQCPYYEYAERFHNVTKSGLLSLPQVKAGTAGLYSSTCYDHAVSNIWLFGAQRVRGVTRAEALLQTIAATEGRGAMPYVVSAWDTFNGGSGCMVKLPSDCGCPGK